MKRSGLTDFLERNMLQLAVIGVGGYILWKMFGAKGSAEAKQAATVSRDIATLESKGITKSYDETTYAAFADRLYKAMFDTGTDEEAIFSVMKKMLNDADLYATIAAFGSRRAAFGDTISPLTWWTLPEWIDNELSASEKMELNAVLAGNNVKYRF
jgi:hypothetical protein